MLTTNSMTMCKNDCDLLPSADDHRRIVVDEGHHLRMAISCLHSYVVEYLSLMICSLIHTIVKVQVTER